MNASKTNTPNPPAWETSDELTLGELLTILWGGRYLLLGSLLGVILLVGIYVWCATPVYEAKALVQIDPKKANAGNQAMANVTHNSFDSEMDVKAEIEILKSNLVLGQVVDTLHLDIVSKPKLTPFLGEALARQKNSMPILDIATFNVPKLLLDKEFVVIAKGDGNFALEGPDGVPIAQGAAGEKSNAQGTWQGQPITLKVANILGADGQRFGLQKQSTQRAIASLKEDFFVSEQAKDTKLLALSLRNTQPSLGADILNKLLSIYISQNIARKSNETSKSLVFMQEQLEQLKTKLEASEEKLNRYRAGTGATDLSAEARVLLDKSAQIDSQVIALRQRRQELLRTYREGSDMDKTISRQISELERASGGLRGQSKRLPHTEQEVVRLSREVQVDQGLYTSLKNSVQQLQMVKAGEAGNAHIVDHASPGLSPVRPQKAILMTIATFLGVLLGLGLIMMRRALRRGIENPQVLEDKLGLPVLAAIPHSAQQKSIQRSDKSVQSKILALSYPKDLAIESLLSLRTNLKFTALESSNKVIMVTGPSPDIGKSFVSVNLAAVIAKSGEKVLLVDADMRKGKLWRYFDMKERSVGLSEVLSSQRGWQDVLRKTIIPDLDFISTGTMPPNPADLLMSDSFKNFIKEVSAAYDIVLLDAPPILAVTDANIIGPTVGTTLMLVNAGRNSLDEIRTALRRLDSVGVRPQGFIFNDVYNITTRYAYNYHYGYAYRE